ncbi:phosphotransferase [Streptomyces sparsogenes]|uniref:phosphotransferase n=1 Tax=Streptomyces sparsogenes TaxID=67365 RepID=UPI00384A5034
MANNPDSESLWALVRPFTGELCDVQPTTRGNSSDVTALVTCETGPLFVKACRNRPGGRRASLVRERLVNPSVSGVVSPALRWHAEGDEWLALGFDVIEARPSRFEPDSHDLGAVVAVVDRFRELALPAEAAKWRESRWDRFAGDDAELFDGATLLFTDINPDNVMIGDDRAWAVDWSWPTRGAAFIDPACLVVQLIAAGHTAAGAEGWVSVCKAWADADPRAIDAFAAANARMTASFAARHLDAPWLVDMAEAARSWAAHRGVAVGSD